MKHDTFKLWQFFRFFFKSGVFSEVNDKGTRDIAQLLIDWKRKQYQKAGR